MMKEYVTALQFNVDTDSAGLKYLRVLLNCYTMAFLKFLYRDFFIGGQDVIGKKSAIWTKPWTATCLISDVCRRKCLDINMVQFCGALLLECCQSLLLKLVCYCQEPRTSRKMFVTAPCCSQSNCVFIFLFIREMLLQIGGIY